ncbi:hypothetical protein BKA70DRAFT_1438057 [Coprinopsis sp. MPI-PUGE-AT-0042]|nr:hypothetical protein BKA70DRAFT_1438057 [Coprinopsis sp. MPI-PUGE-AT-0042]
MCSIQVNNSIPDLSVPPSSAGRSNGDDLPLAPSIPFTSKPQPSIRTHEVREGTLQWCAAVDFSQPSDAPLSLEMQPRSTNRHVEPLRLPTPRRSYHAGRVWWSGGASTVTERLSNGGAGPVKRQRGLGFPVSLSPLATLAGGSIITKPAQSIEDTSPSRLDCRNLDEEHFGVNENPRSSPSPDDCQPVSTRFAGLRLGRQSQVATR